MPRSARRSPASKTATRAASLPSPYWPRRWLASSSCDRDAIGKTIIRRTDHCHGIGKLYPDSERTRRAAMSLVRDAAGPAQDCPVDPLELTILMPCLNEAETIATCIAKAQSFLARSRIAGEVLVADNGSTDGSTAL